SQGGPDRVFYPHPRRPAESSRGCREPRPAAMRPARAGGCPLREGVFCLPERQGLSVERLFRLLRDGNDLAARQSSAQDCGQVGIGQEDREPADLKRDDRRNHHVAVFLAMTKVLPRIVGIRSTTSSPARATSLSIVSVAW